MTNKELLHLKNEFGLRMRESQHATNNLRLAYTEKAISWFEYHEHLSLVRMAFFIAKNAKKDLEFQYYCRTGRFPE